MGQLSRRLSPMTLFMLSMNGIIGSGWLFAPLFASKIAGPASIYSWIIGGFASILVAFTFAELSTMLPFAGGTARIPQLTHGALASFVISWLAWLSSLILAPIEVQAVLQYASFYFPMLTQNENGVAVLSHLGYLWATMLMASLCVINVMSYQGLVRFNFIMFIFKFSVVLLTIFAISHARFTVSNFDGLMTSVTNLDGWKTILSAVATSGIVLAFNGFKNGVELAGETRNLKVAIPLSTVGSVAACLFLYLGLQICFIGALDPSSLKNGWHALNFAGDIGPFVGLATGLGLVVLLKLLYLNAMVSPLSAGLVYTTTTARILYAMSKIGYVPKFLSYLNKQHFPVWAILINFVIGMCSFLPLPGWQAMVNFLVSAMVITYAMGPIALLSLRLTMPHQKRPFRLPAANLLCVSAFYCCNLFSYWTGWETISKLAIALGVGLSFFFISYMRGAINLQRHELRSALWLLPYLFGLVVISYFGAFGGTELIPFGMDFLVIGLFSVGILYLAVRCRSELTTEEVNVIVNADMLAVEH